MFVDQQFAASDGQKGDCVRACLASILDRPITAVPHFALLDLADGIHVAMEALVGWLMYHGYETDIAPSPASLPLHIINGISPRGIPHAVVGDTASSAVVHDPHPSRAGLSMISGRIYLSRAEASRDEHIAAVERAARAAAFREAAEVCERWADKWRPDVPVRDRYADGLSSGADELADALRARAEGQSNG